MAAGGHCQGEEVWNGPALVSHHPVRNSERSTRQERLRASARCSLGVERGGWGCRRSVRNWGGVTPTWRPHTGSAGAHLQIRSEFGFFAGLKPVTSVQRHESPRFFGNRHHWSGGGAMAQQFALSLVEDKKWGFEVCSPCVERRHRRRSFVCCVHSTQAPLCSPPTHPICQPGRELNPPYPDREAICLPAHVGNHFSTTTRRRA